MPIRRKSMTDFKLNIVSTSIVAPLCAVVRTVWTGRRQRSVPGTQWQQP
jgi:hypothetical protein